MSEAEEKRIAELRDRLGDTDVWGRIRRRILRDRGLDPAKEKMIPGEIWAKQAQKGSLGDMVNLVALMAPVVKIPGAARKGLDILNKVHAASSSSLPFDLWAERLRGELGKLRDERGRRELQKLERLQRKRKVQLR